jgi:CubicO group peptidase (beta-lactamase class C family)
MKHIRKLAIIPLISLLGLAAGAQAPQRAAAGPAGKFYFPVRDRWEVKKPAEVGMDAAALEEAIAFAKTAESSFGKVDYHADQIRTFGRPLGPVPASRGGMNAVIVRHGYIVAEFGDTSVVEPTYSVAKSYLSTVLGLALDRGLIKSITDPVGQYVHDGGYDSPHNAKITWEDHARQASEWEGTMFGKPSTFIGHEEFGNGEMKPREIKQPGTYYEYNDVRVNRLSLSLLRVWKRPLPDVLKTQIMDPIGASDTWRWIGYDNADVEVDGKTMKSVPGGTRWGGGMWASSRDHARYGYLMLRNGKWNGRQLVSESWIKQATTQGGPPNSNDYGYLWWLNTKAGKRDLPRTSYSAQGNGSNSIWIDPDHDLVVVWRWYGGRNSEDEFFKRVVASIHET